MRMITGALLGLVLMIGPVQADDAAGIRAVIGAQIEAFKADDGPAAYDFAAPRLKRIFPNSDVFMAMVRQGYQPVYRPKSVTWGRMRQTDEGFAQEVFVVGPDGQSYTAFYRLERQADGSLKISGCQIVKSVGGTA